MRNDVGSWSQAARNGPVSGRLCQIQSWLVGPAIASSSAAASRTVRASGPCTDRPLISALSGAVETRPRLVLMPNNPLTLAGMRIEPPPSLPGAAGRRPAATAGPAPPREPAPDLPGRPGGSPAAPPAPASPLEPPADRLRSHGVRAGGCPSGSV